MIRIEGLPDETASLLEEYFKAHRLNKKTIINYVKSAQAYTRLINKPIDTSTSKSDIQRFYERMVDSGLSAATCLSWLTNIRLLLRYAHVKAGKGKREAQRFVEDLFEDIPLSELRREKAKMNNMRDKVLSAEEFERLLSAAEHPRLKAAIAVLYEGALRVGELISLRVRDVEFKREYATLKVKGKTGERTVPIVKALPYLQAWMQIHPQRNNLDAPLFCRPWKGRLGSLTAGSLNTAFRRLCRKAGLRHIHPHMLRHTRLTELAKRGLGEYQLKSFAGWTSDSNMAAVYVKLAGKAHLSPILRMEGVEVKEEKSEEEEKLKVKTCPRCGAKNPFDARFCLMCSLALDQETALKIEAGELKIADESLASRLREKMKDPLFRERLVNVLLEALKVNDN